ncbi:hypothetical protein NL676_008962 [Syzygium grande]|nr:hypothetical protein NL676_008962 [Syzygium grande]
MHFRPPPSSSHVLAPHLRLQELLFVLLHRYVFSFSPAFLLLICSVEQWTAFGRAVIHRSATSSLLWSCTRAKLIDLRSATSRLLQSA